MAPLRNCIGLAEPLPEGRWRLPWKDHRYGLNLGSLVRTTPEAAIKWMEVSRLSASKESAPCTRWCEGDVHCGVYHPWVNTVPCCTSMADGKCCLLLQFLGTPPSSSTQEKATDTCWQRTPSSFMTMRGVTLLTRWRISFAAGDGRYWNIRHTHPMSLCDYDLFAKMKEPLRGKR
jgi:hypothetical protein